MSHCKDCKFWDEEHPRTHNGICKRLDEPSDLARIAGFYRDECFLVTHKEFGCVMFEPTPEPAPELQKE